jgi:hypothetical protein
MFIVCGRGNLGTRGFRVKDQTGRTVSIIEALNLDCCDTTKIDSHE